MFVIFFFQAEDGIRDLVRSRGLGDVYKRQAVVGESNAETWRFLLQGLWLSGLRLQEACELFWTCLLYTSDAADDLLCVDLGGRRIIKKKNKYYSTR